MKYFTNILLIFINKINNQLNKLKNHLSLLDDMVFTGFRGMYSAEIAINHLFGREKTLVAKIVDHAAGHDQCKAKLM